MRRPLCSESGLLDERLLNLMSDLNSGVICIASYPSPWDVIRQDREGLPDALAVSAQCCYQPAGSDDADPLPSDRGT